MTRHSPLDGFSLYLLMFAALFAGAPHADHLPKWVSLLGASIWLWRLHIAHRNLRLPNRWLISIFTVAAAIGVYFHYRSLFGRDAGVALLTLMLALKLLETRTRRDGMIVIFLGYFLVITNFLYFQSVAIAAYMFGVVWLITMSMVGFQQRAPRLGWRTALGTSGLLFVQAVPLMLVMFLFFPRIQGPLWSLPQEAYSATTGLSDTMSPGTLSKLSLSDAVAFRAHFVDEPPTRARLYWRGPVMWDFDGKTWRVGSPVGGTAPEFMGLGDPVHYSVTLEPHDLNWLFAIELPAAAPDGSRVTPDFQILYARPVRNRLRYDVTSYLSFRMAPQKASVEELQRGLQLPPAGAARARALAGRIRSEAASSDEVLEKALEFFRTRPFYYTLSPPLLGDDPVDEFLFQTQRGFCEHYASAFTFLMRAAGVPARIVTGYQGGSLNPIGDYIIVRQADAHAWAEVWLDNQGWVRVDPTAVVSPQRLDAGLAAAVPDEDPVPLLSREDVPWLSHAFHRWDAITNAWNQWVLGYNPERQRSFLSRVGFDDATWRTMAMVMLGTTVVVLLVLTALLLFNFRSRGGDPTQRAWQRFCRKLARRGMARHPSEGPVDYARRVALQLPRRAEDIGAISDLYVHLRYGKGSDPEEARKLKSLVAAFKV
jgi:transglutaminase-like putative cysteine protease